MPDYLLVVAPISVDVTNDVVALYKIGKSKKKYRNSNAKLPHGCFQENLMETAGGLGYDQHAKDPIES